MKYKNIIFGFVFLSLLIILSAFKIWNVRSLLTSYPWTSVETWNDFDADGIFVLDTAACRMDNHWSFFLNGNVMITEGPIKCEPDLPFLDTISGQWTLENNDTRLKILFAGGEDQMGMVLYSIGPNVVEFHFSGSENPNDLVVRQRVILHR